MASSKASNKVPLRSAHDMNYEEWSEEQLEGALAKLKDTHLKITPAPVENCSGFANTSHISQLRSLRSTIPRMVQPLASEPTQPQILHAKCTSSLVAGVEEVRAFKEAVSSDDFRKVIDHAASSRRRNSKNIKPWKPRDDPSWASTTQS
ncbi:hypothetical protein F503_06098 [Ophiostoma piceae UAMH 11346]|uniref:Uncharacterized protein n=1 Tax=Ophiostoma piceae (strain UAMH 11346) TaxID=1262450 RepID=S3CW94_OPHP1|nr:hypothetical protein F503_06098 [Ophiostoma piceae UAMH 11346]